MDIVQINEMLEHDPFVPFRIKLADGSGYDIRNPGLVVPMQTEVMIVFPADNRYAVVSRSQIVALERLPVPRGKGRRKKSA